MLAESLDGFLLATVHPAVLPVRVWVYCAVTWSSNTVSVPSVTVSEPLVQVTVVAGPPVEVQVRVNPLLSAVFSRVIVSDTVTSPTILRNERR